MSSEPRTAAEWQEAVDLANGLLVIDSAQKYGLVSGGPEIDTARCTKILAGGRRRGVLPAHDSAERVAVAFAGLAEKSA